MKIDRCSGHVDTIHKKALKHFRRQEVEVSDPGRIRVVPACADAMEGDKAIYIVIRSSFKTLLFRRTMTCSAT